MENFILTSATAELPRGCLKVKIKCNVNSAGWVGGMRQNICVYVLFYGNKS